MSYDHWKTTNPDDEWLGPDPEEEKSLKPIPPLESDEAAEKFVEEADLSEYDLSGFKPTKFEIKPKKIKK